MKDFMDLKKEYAGRSTQNLVLVCLHKLNQIQESMPQTIEVPIYPGSRINTRAFVVTNLKMRSIKLGKGKTKKCAGYKIVQAW